MCGPKPMLKAGMDAGRALGWPRDRIAFELFYSVATDAAATPPVAAPVAPAAPAPAPAPAALPDGSFEVVLKSNGKAYRVPPDKSIVEVLVAAGLDPINDCNRGECGVCQVGVLEGIPDHRDHILSNSEKASNKTMQICVSRSKSPRLVLDL
jgi:vanillate O-demethylase ferredoxin subunit